MFKKIMKEIKRRPRYWIMQLLICEVVMVLTMCLIGVFFNRFTDMSTTVFYLLILGPVCTISQVRTQLLQKDRKQ